MSSLLVGRLSRAEFAPSLLCSSTLPSRGAHTCLSSWKARLGSLRGSPYSLILNRRRGSARVRATGAPEAQEEIEEENSKQVDFSVTRLGTQALICVLTLGFLDAGYSGDWSRIGVLSKEVESALRVGAYGVVPLAFYLLWFISSSNRRS